jgi:hypothetical protein
MNAVTAEADGVSAPGWSINDALTRLREALVIIDDLGVPPDVGARLQETIERLEYLNQR